MDELKQIVLKKELNERINWIIRLRWLAVIGVFIVISGTHYVLKIKVPLIPLYIGNLILFSYNLLFWLYISKNNSQNDINKWFNKANRFANLQITLDFLMLTYFIHFTGGIENPFIFYFIFHMVIASILLSKQAAYLQATIAIIYLSITVFFEYLNIIPHYHTIGFIPENLCLLNFPYLMGVLFVFTTTLYITVYLATSIVDRLREGERELAIANKKLEEQDILKSQYVLTVSHDLKASLSTIQSCLKVVLNNLSAGMSDKAKEMIIRAEQRSRYLLHFVKDLLDLSRIRAAKEIVKTDILLSDSIEKIIEQLKIKVDEKNIDLLSEKIEAVYVHANIEALEELIMNLLFNAINYTPQGGKISICSQKSDNQNFIQVSVTDNGIGIPQEDLPYIFEDFFRAKNAQVLEKNGTGLGLSIAKQIVETHEGKIWTESQMGKGSKFVFTLPKSNK
jgi:signal transduction histidine kinase